MIFIHKSTAPGARTENAGQMPGFAGRTGISCFGGGHNGLKRIYNRIKAHLALKLVKAKVPAEHLEVSQQQVKSPASLSSFLHVINLSGHCTFFNMKE